MSIKNFNPHFRKGSDGFRADAYIRRGISIHTSAREVTVITVSRVTSYSISIHTSAREVTKRQAMMRWQLWDFNPHFRKGSDFMEDYRIDLIDISIHTSAREVTRWFLENGMQKCNFNPHFRKGSDETVPGWLYRKRWFQSTLPQGKWPGQAEHLSRDTTISIHTSAREVTYLKSRGSRGTLFQSTLPQGKWLFEYAAACDGFWISIHTSAREVTIVAPFVIASIIDFNPHFRKGSDSYSVSGPSSGTEFQSTLPQGKWPMLPWLPQLLADFNPHFRKGSDVLPCLRYCIRKISIHTSAREVTFSIMDCQIPEKFQSTLPQGKWRFFQIL